MEIGNKNKKEKEKDVMKQMKERMIYIAILMLLTQSALAKPLVEVKINPVSPASLVVEKNENFTVNVTLDPNGTEIAGAQYNLIFGSKLSIIDNQEGNLFNRNMSSIYEKGINSTAGIIINVWSLISIANHSATERGNMSTITMVALANGTFPLNLSRVIVANPNGQAVDNIIVNASVISSPRPDITGAGGKPDFYVNILDSTTLQQCIKGKIDVAICPRCDLTYDNPPKCNGTDWEKIVKFGFGPILQP